MYELSGAGRVTHTVQCRPMAMDGRMFSEIHSIAKGSDDLSYEDQWKEMGIFSLGRT